MEREELVKSKGYWLTSLQISLYNFAVKFMAEHDMNKTQLAEYLGMSNEMVTSILRGDFDQRVSKLVEIALALGYVPEFNFTSFDDYLVKDALIKGSEA